ncbi:MAG: glucosidase, partial [Planctomycetota bacterium]
FDEDRYFDVVVEYAKASPDGLLIVVTAHNRGPDEALLHLLPQLWFRNTWSWGDGDAKPELRREAGDIVVAEREDLGTYHFYCDGSPELLFSENETNANRLFASEEEGHFKDAFHEYLIAGRSKAVNAAGVGTKVAAHFDRSIAAGESVTVRMRLTRKPYKKPFADFAKSFALRKREADEYYAELQKRIPDADARAVQRQALAGILWSKQFYSYDVAEWLEGDPGHVAPPPQRKEGRNREWEHLNNADILSMPDTWEFPWYAAWDLAFQCIPLAMVDAEFAKQQLILLTREWYMHPNGQLPAYEWALGDVNPPVHAWGAWRVYKMDKKAEDGRGDLDFLERVFHKLLLNFTWWVNRKD